MRNYAIRRLALVIPTVILVSMIIFLLMRLLPGDIVTAMQAAMQEREAGGKLDRAAIEHELGLDVSIPHQYGRWVGVLPQADGSFSGILQGDLGSSWWQGLTVVELVALKWPVTFELGLMSLIIAQLIAIPIGVYSAIRQDAWGDYIGRSFAILAISIPSFWIGTLIIVYPSIWWNYMPPIMLVHFTEDPLGNLRMFIVPAIILGLAYAGFTMRLSRTMMLEVLRQDYIRTAWAKGLKEKIVVTRHALKNALIPVITIVGLSMPVMIGGTVIIEQIFVLPGMGRLIIGAIQFRDYPLMSGIMVIYTSVIVLINIMVDLTYAYLDPRVRYK